MYCVRSGCLVWHCHPGVAQGALANSRHVWMEATVGGCRCGPLAGGCECLYKMQWRLLLGLVWMPGARSSKIIMYAANPVGIVRP